MKHKCRQARSQKFIIGGYWGVWGQDLQPTEANESLGVKSPSAGDWGSRSLPAAWSKRVWGQMLKFLL